MEGRVYEYLCSNPQIKDYFLSYRQEDWNNILLETLLFGILSIKATHSRHLQPQELHEKLKRAGAIKNVEETIPSLKSKLNSLRKEIALLEDQLEEKPKKVEFIVNENAEEYCPPKPKVKKVDFWNQTNFHKKPEIKETIKPKIGKPWAHDFSQVIKNDQRSPTSYELLSSQAKESKNEENFHFRSQDQSDLKTSNDSKAYKEYPKEKQSSGNEVRFSGYDKKFATDPHELLHSSESKDINKFSGGSNDLAFSTSKQKSSGSSMSHYNPTEDMKKFYRNEFGRFLESKGTNKEEESED